MESMTRLSRSSYEIWKDIFATNRDEIALALEEFLSEAKRLKQELEKDDSSKIGEYFGQK